MCYRHTSLDKTNHTKRSPPSLPMVETNFIRAPPLSWDFRSSKFTAKLITHTKRRGNIVRIIIMPQAPDSSEGRYPSKVGEVLITVPNSEANDQFIRQQNKASKLYTVNNGTREGHVDA